SEAASACDAAFAGWGAIPRASTPAKVAARRMRRAYMTNLLAGSGGYCERKAAPRKPRFAFVQAKDVTLAVKSAERQSAKKACRLTFVLDETDGRAVRNSELQMPTGPH